MAKILAILNVSCHAMSHSCQMLDDFMKSIDQVPEPVSKALASVQVVCTSGLDMVNILIWLKNLSVHTRRHLWMEVSSFAKRVIQQGCEGKEGDSTDSH